MPELTRCREGLKDWLLWCDVVAEESPEEFDRRMAREVGGRVRVDGGVPGFVRVVGRRL